MEPFEALVGLKFTFKDHGVGYVEGPFVVTEYDGSHLIVHRTVKGPNGKPNPSMRSYSGWRIEAYTFIDMWDMCSWATYDTAHKCDCTYHYRDDDDYMCKWCRYNLLREAVGYAEPLHA